LLKMLFVEKSKISNFRIINHDFSEIISAYVHCIIWISKIKTLNLSR
jgi:hypothetical protein